MKLKIRINKDKVAAFLPLVFQIFGSKLSDTEISVLGLLLHQQIPEKHLNTLLDSVEKE